VPTELGSRDSSVDTARGYGLNGPSSILGSVQIDSVAHPASYLMGMGALSPGVKRQGREADHSPPSIFLVGWDYRYCDHFWPIVQAPDDRWGWLWSNWWTEDWQGKPKYSDKTCPSATLSTTNPTWPDQGSNSGRRGGKPATNRLSYGADLHPVPRSRKVELYLRSPICLHGIVFN
jgi:hypothetical protein